MTDQHLIQNLTDQTATSSLLGHWVLLPDPNDEEYSLTGQITLSIEGHHLVKLHPLIKEVPPFSKLMTSDALCAAGIYIFTTREELEAWMGWDPDDRPRVVSMRKGE